jgi:hypothetical protein
MRLHIADHIKVVTVRFRNASHAPLTVVRHAPDILAEATSAALVFARITRPTIGQRRSRMRSAICRALGGIQGGWPRLATMLIADLTMPGVD